MLLGLLLKVVDLLLSLTVSSTLFVKFVKDSNTYYKDEKLEATFSEKQTLFLENERK